jgi:hypothetical protein
MLIHFVSGVSCNAVIAPAYYNKRYMKELIDTVIDDVRQLRGNSVLLRPIAV